MGPLTTPIGGAIGGPFTREWAPSGNLKGAPNCRCQGALGLPMDTAWGPSGHHLKQLAETLLALPVWKTAKTSSSSRPVGRRSEKVQYEFLAPIAKWVCTDSATTDHGSQQYLSAVPSSRYPRNDTVHCTEPVPNLDRVQRV
jgi:hypothetical protein